MNTHRPYGNTNKNNILNLFLKNHLARKDETHSEVSSGGVDLSLFKSRSLLSKFDIL